MPVERRAEEVKNGASEGTEMAKRDQTSQEPQPTAATATSAQGQSGAAARPDGDGPEDTVSRTLRQKVTYEKGRQAFSCRPILRLHDAADFNRRMRKTARPVVWEGAGAQSPAPDPFGATTRR